MFSNIGSSKLIPDRPILIVILSRSIILPEEIQILRIPSRRVTRLFKLRHFINYSRIIGQRARKAGTALARTQWYDCLVDDGANEDAGFAESGGVASHAFESQVAAHGHDVGGVIGMREGDGVVGEMLFGDVDSKGCDDGGDVGVVGADMVLAGIIQELGKRHLQAVEHGSFLRSSFHQESSRVGVDLAYGKAVWVTGSVIY